MTSARQSSSQRLLIQSQTFHPKILEETIQREMQQSPLIKEGEEHQMQRKSTSFN